MEYAKDEIFNITYNSTKDKLEMKKERKKSKTAVAAVRWIQVKIRLKLEK